LSKSLPFTTTVDGVCLLIPKERGEGFKRQPAGHHRNKLIDFVDAQIGLDCTGLDGYLLVVTPSYRAEEYVERVVPLLAEFTGANPQRLGIDDFFEIVKGKA
jgi:hypothetical protein